VKTLDLDLELHMREDVPVDGSVAVLYGRAVPYDTPTNIGGVSESFAPGAFTPSEVMGKPLAWRHGEPIGMITGAANEPDGLYITANILDTVQGRDAATLARAGAVKGLSVGFVPTESKWNRAKTAVTHLAAQLAETSLTHMPAYATAGVSEIREEGDTMSETTTVETSVVPAEDVQAREALVQVREELAQLQAAVNVTEAAHPLAKYRTFGDYAKAVYTGVEDRALEVSNLADAAGAVPPVWFKDVKGVLDRGRPCINALGGAQSVAGAGMTVNWPYFDGDLSAIAAVQAAENDEINSADIDIKKGTATLATHAAGNRLTYQVIERTDPSYVTAHMRILMGAYGTETEYAFQAGLWANDTYGGVDYDFSADTTGSAFMEAVWNAAVVCQLSTGQPAEAVLVNTAIYKKLGGWSAFQAQNYPVQNTGGVFDGRTGRATIMGLPLILAQSFATDETQDAIVTNSASVAWLEDGPRVASADVVSNLGRETGIYGYGTTAPYITGGIVSIYNHA
jgi:HK97 family phage prohead protease